MAMAAGEAGEARWPRGVGGGEPSLVLASEVKLEVAEVGAAKAECLGDIIGVLEGIEVAAIRT